MHSFEALAILVLALCTALPALSAPVQTSAVLQSLNQRPPASLGNLSSGLLNKLETTDSFGKVLNETRRDFDENSGPVSLIHAKFPRPYLGILPVIPNNSSKFSVPDVYTRSFNDGSTSDKSLHILADLYKNNFKNSIISGRSFRHPSPLSLGDIEGVGINQLSTLSLHLRSGPKDSPLDQDDTFSVSPDERRRGAIDDIKQLKDLKDSFKHTIH